jgi:hypothetical protein
MIAVLDSGIGAVGAVALADALRSNKTVTDLNLTCAGPVIALGMQADVSLVRLCTGNKFGDEGATAMADMLRVNRTLRELDLSCTLGQWYRCRAHSY